MQRKSDIHHSIILIGVDPNLFSSLIGWHEIKWCSDCFLQMMNLLQILNSRLEWRQFLIVVFFKKNMTRRLIHIYFINLWLSTIRENRSGELWRLTILMSGISPQNWRVCSQTIQYHSHLQWKHLLQMITMTSIVRTKRNHQSQTTTVQFHPKPEIDRTNMLSGNISAPRPDPH